MIVLTCNKVSKDFFVGCLILRINFQTVGLTHSSAVIFRAILFTFEATLIKLIRFLCQSLKNKLCWGVICYALEWLVEGKPWPRIWLTLWDLCPEKTALDWCGSNMESYGPTYDSWGVIWSHKWLLWSELVPKLLNDLYQLLSDQKWYCFKSYDPKSVNIHFDLPRHSYN